MRAYLRGPPTRDHWQTDKPCSELHLPSANPAITVPLAPLPRQVIGIGPYHSSVSFKDGTWNRSRFPVSVSPINDCPERLLSRMVLRLK